MEHDLPNRIKALREERGWSLRALEDRTRITHTKLHRIETGATAPDYDDLKAIARAFGARISALLNDDDVETRADEFGDQLLDLLKTIPPENRPDVVVAASSVVRAARGIAAQNALSGQPRQVAALAEAWNNFRDEERKEALELWRIAKIGRFAEGQEG